MNKTFIKLNISLITLFFISCGPTPCECLEQYQTSGLSFNSRGGLKYKSNISPTLVKKCISKYGDEIPNNIRGTQKFQDEMKKILSKKCK